jgi:multiple sugar transport system permease protein
MATVEARRVFKQFDDVRAVAYFTGIQGGDLAAGAAISLFMFPVLAAVAILFLRVARRTEVT